MDDWRRNRGEYSNRTNYQSASKSFGRSQYRKPQQQIPPDFWQPDVPSWVSNVPSWERRFITTICRMPWGRFVHCQKGLELYEDIFRWDDAAGGEAFQNAKSRFWADINGLYCDISLPDPDMYVDEIDWNATTDPELYAELEKVAMFPVEEVKAGFTEDPAYQKDEPIVPSGWDEEEPNVQGGDNKTSNKVNPWVQNDHWKGLGWGATNLSSLMKPIIPPGCDVGEDDPSNKTTKSSCHPNLQDCEKNTNKNKIDPWEANCGGWEANKNNDPWKGNCGGWEGNNNNLWEGNCGGWEGRQWGSSSEKNNTPNESSANLNFYENSGNWRRGNDNWRKREGDGQQMSRYKTTRYHHNDDYQADQGWRNNRGKKRVSFAHEHSPMEPIAPRQWNSIHTCGPVNQHRPGEAGNSWGWEKQVSYHIN